MSYISAKRVPEISILKEEDLLEALPEETAREQEAISIERKKFLSLIQRLQAQH